MMNDDTNRVRADSGLPHVSLFRAQVRDLHSQPGRQGLHITCQPGAKGGGGEREDRREEDVKTFVVDEGT